MGLSKLPAPDVLRELLRYEPETGKLYWRERSVKWFAPSPHRGGMRSAEWAMSNWNSKFAGKEALRHLNPSGYKAGAVLKVPCVAHRVAFSIYHNRELVGQIDHISGDKADNRIKNLREVDRTGNARNVALYSSNKSGTPGVIWEASRQAWAVKINYNGTQRRIGRFKKKADAIAARKNAEVVHGYHPNHGRLAVGG